MLRTRIDRYKVRLQMAKCRMERFEDLIEKAKISQTTFYASVDSHAWKSRTLDSLADALGCAPLELLSVDEAGDEKE